MDVEVIEDHDDPYSDSYSDASDSSDPEYKEQESSLRLMFGQVVYLASRLKDYSKFVELSFNILKYLKDGDHDVKSFSEMVNQVLSYERFLNELYDECRMSGYFKTYLRTCASRTQCHKNTDDKLSRIKNDPFFEEDEKLLRNDPFLVEALEGGDPEIVVRGALSVLLGHCINEEDLRNMGVLEFDSDYDSYDSYSDDSDDSDDENMS